jgi:uncharacterized repeat protein (TIGR01451 family)
MKNYTLILKPIVLSFIMTLGVMMMFQLLTPAKADEPNKAQVVVVLPGEQVTVRSITFTGEISRPTALELAGFKVIADGDIVCSIEGVGCPADNCFCSDNWWSNAKWDDTASNWDTINYTTPASNNDIVGFRWSNSSWGPPKLSGPAYKAASDSLSWLQSQQVITNGSYGNSAGNSVETMFSLGANSQQATNWRPATNAPSLLNYMLNNSSKFADGGDVAAPGKLAVAFAATDGCWPVEAMTIMDSYSSTTGGFSIGSSPQAWAILGLKATSQTVPVKAIQFLKDGIQPNGGWEWFPDWDTDTNATAMAIQALIATGEPATSTVIISGLNYLKSSQNSDGGFPYTPQSAFGTESDGNSTAYVIQAILATGQDPLTGTWRVGGNNPISYMLSLQLADGSFEWQKGKGSNLLASQQAVTALLGRPYPFKSQSLAQCGFSMSTQTNVSQADVGQTINYTYLITNTGDLTLTGLIAVDDKLGPVTLDRTTLASKQTATGILTHIVTDSDFPGPLTNMVTVTGTLLSASVTNEAMFTTVKATVMLPVRNYLPAVSK